MPPPTLVNSLTFGTNRSNNYNQSRAVNMNPDWDSTLGIANGSGPVFPGFEFNGSPFPSFGENDDAQDVDNTIALNDICTGNMARTASRSAAKTQYHQYSFVSKIGGTCSGTSGCFSFWDNQTASDTTYWGRDGNSFAAFLIGQAGTANALASFMLRAGWLTTERCLPRTTGSCAQTSRSTSGCAGATIRRVMKPMAIRRS